MSNKLPTARMVFKRVVKDITIITTHFTGLSFFWRSIYANRGVRILAYHGVEPIPSNSYSVSLDNFKLQMEYLKNHYTVVPLSEYERTWDSGRNKPGKTVILTFDDGFKNFYQNAFPILKEYGLPATCFIISSKINDTDNGYMNCNELKELLDSKLIQLGSHTVTHRHLSTLEDGQLVEEVVESKKYLESKMASKIDSFSYPYGTPRDFDQRCLHAIERSSYKLACTSINGVNLSSTNRFKIRRTKIEWGDNLSNFKKILKGAVDIWIVVDFCFGFLQNRKEVDFAESQDI